MKLNAQGFCEFTQADAAWLRGAMARVLSGLARPLFIQATTRTLDTTDPWLRQRGTIGPWGSTRRPICGGCIVDEREMVDAEELLLWLAVPPAGDAEPSTTESMTLDLTRALDAIRDRRGAAVTSQRTTKGDSSDNE